MNISINPKNWINTQLTANFPIFIHSFIDCMHLFIFHWRVLFFSIRKVQYFDNARVYRYLLTNFSEIGARPLQFKTLSQPTIGRGSDGRIKYGEVVLPLVVRRSSFTREARAHASVRRVCTRPHTRVQPYQSEPVHSQFSAQRSPAFALSLAPILLSVALVRIIWAAPVRDGVTIYYHTLPNTPKNAGAMGCRVRWAFFRWTTFLCRSMRRSNFLAITRIFFISRRVFHVEISNGTSVGRISCLCRDLELN